LSYLCRILLLAWLLAVLVADASAFERLKLATTTSTENSGLLAVLLPPFEKANSCKVDVIATGTGKALKLGESGDVDVLLVHARSKEEAFVNADSVAAFKSIALSRSPFISRGDESGTHIKEMALWQEAELMPEGAWYYEAGRGMGDVIIMATEKSAYTIADRGTYLAFETKTDLIILSEGDTRLFNPYGVMIVNPQRHSHVKAELAEALVAYLHSEKARKIVNGYHRSGQQLFFMYNH
jgi:tungstate transport system substrate-binding protein